MIFLITGPEKTGKSQIANALRNNAVSFKKGALLVDHGSNNELKALLEKIISGTEYKKEVGLDKLPWKTDVQIILVGEQCEWLEKFEAELPGFAKKFGPVVQVSTTRG